MGKRHEYYELLNLIGYGLAKFDMDFVREFGFTSKSQFFNYFVNLGIVSTASTIKNRMDLFDPFFENGRKGWWQKGDTYKHRKDFIDSLFGQENVATFAMIIKSYLVDNNKLESLIVKNNPFLTTRFNKLQETGLEAELYFMNHFSRENLFRDGILSDARLYGDGYDFQIETASAIFLAEVKGIRSNHGKIRLTEKEFYKAEEFQDKYILSVVSSLEERPKLTLIENPIASLEFKKVIRSAKDVVEFHLVENI